MPPSKKKNRNFYGEVEVTAKLRLQFDGDFSKLPTKHDVLEALQTGNFREIADEELFEYLEVTDIEDLAEIPPEESDLTSESLIEDGGELVEAETDEQAAEGKTRFPEDEL